MRNFKKFRGFSDCEKLIEYQIKDYHGGGTVQGLFSIEEFKTETKTITEVPDLAKILDDFQYQKCKDAENAQTEDERKQFLEQRTTGYDFLTALRVTVAVTNNKDSIHLDNAIYNIQKFLGMEEMIEERKKIIGEFKISKELDARQELDFEEKYFD